MTPPPQDELAAALALALDTGGKGARRSGSVATSASGARYAAGSVTSQTHLLDIPSELAALARAAHAHDREIVEVATVTSDLGAYPSPLVLKILADHAARTGRLIAYHLFTESGGEIYSTLDAASALPSYASPMKKLGALAEQLSPASALPSGKLEEELKRYALAGALRNFPTRDGASGYGAAVLAGDTIFYGGQYSAPDERLGLHAEMAVLVNVLMSGAGPMSAIGIASPKFKERPATPCGVCRQFMHEVCTVRGWEPTTWCFAVEGPPCKSTLAELLPLQWSNKV